MDKKAKIGIFDSGIGGVTVLNEIIKILPYENYIYYSDSKNNPYGDKSEEQIKDICNNIVKYLLNNNCKIIVIACNTASAIAAEYLRNKYIDVPIIAIEPAYKMVHDYAYDKSTLIMATKGTINSEKFNKLYNKYNNNKTYILECVGLADLIEKSDDVEINNYLKKNLSIYRGKVENVVLGCTHYPLIENEIKEALGNVQFFNGAKRLAEHLKSVLLERNLESENDGNIQFIDSQNSKYKEERFYKILRKK